MEVTSTDRLKESVNNDNNVIKTAADDQSINQSIRDSQSGLSNTNYR